VYAYRTRQTMKRSSTSSGVNESCEKQPPAKRSWGLGSLLHGLADYVRPKHGSAKDKSACNAASRDTETALGVGDECNKTTWLRSAVNEPVPGVINESVYAEANASASVTRNETSAHLPKYESTLSRSSTFSYAQSNDQQPRTHLLPRFRRNSKNR